MTAPVESPELMRLRVLWYALRARGMDAAGAPGIAYDRPVVQTSPTPPTVPHGYGMGRERDPVADRIAQLAGTEAAVTLRWYRSYDATGAWASGSVEAILDACVRALATAEQCAAWGRAGTASGREGKALAAHVTAAGRTWARARFRRAWAAWHGEAAQAAEGTT